MSANDKAEQHRPAAGWIYEQTSLLNVSEEGRIASLAAGSIALLSLFAGKASLGKLLFSSYFLYRGISGNCPVTAVWNSRKPAGGEKHVSNLNIRTSFTVQRPRSEVYSYWRNLSNLPLFMRHLASVRETGDKTSHWELKLPAVPFRVKWDAELVEEEKDRELSWRSVEGSMIETAGKVTFRDIDGGETLVDLLITYRPPAGHIGHGLGRIFSYPFRVMVESDISNFTRHMEDQPAQFDRTPSAASAWPVE